MIAGIFIRNYKCYSNINFIPFIESDEELLSVFIGSNGVGKSTILEAIGCILNNTDTKMWETSIGQKKDRTYICPVFLLKKNIWGDDKKLAAVSDVFLNSDLVSYSGSEAVRDFSAWRDRIKGVIDFDKYYMVAIGKNYDGDVIFTSTLHKKIFDSTKRVGVSRQYVSSLMFDILSMYSYVYIPIENKISDILSLQASEMQSLMDKSVVDEIRNLLASKDYAGDGIRQSSIIDLINKKLDDYIVDINGKISSGYKFEPRGTNKKTIKPNDILHAILNEYFSIRTLTKDGKQIKSLSSGQQRMALMDVASTLLSSNSEKSRDVILAIDEPESSLEAANRFHQFSRLVDISENNGHQILLTTHWYGLLLRPSVGRLHFVSEDAGAPPQIKSFTMKNLYDHRRNFPDSIEMKSYFDLMSSMLSILKNGYSNWLICEGYEDALYLSAHLGVVLKNTYILPFNGCGNVKKLYEFLSVPFSDKTEISQIKGKVFCLIDNDEKSLIKINGYDTGRFGGKLRFERLLLDRDGGDASLISAASTIATNTEIEDLMDVNFMWSALVEAANYFDDLKELVGIYEFNDDAKFPDISKNLSLLKRNTLQQYQRHDEIREILCRDEVKVVLAKCYFDAVLKSGFRRPLAWMEKIVNYFEEEMVV